MAESDSNIEQEPLNSRLAGNVMEHSFSTLLADQEKSESSTSSEGSLDIIKDEVGI